MTRETEETEETGETGETGEGSVATEAEASTPVAPAVRVVSGRPTDEELAALIAVLTAATGGGATQAGPSPSRWAAPSTRLRSAYGPSRGGWRASGLPR